jgi:hypothetical protein
MEGRHWNATAGENNSAKPWRDWFVLFASEPLVEWRDVADWQ